MCGPNDQSITLLFCYKNQYKQSHLERTVMTPKDLSSVLKHFWFYTISGKVSNLLTHLLADHPTSAMEEL